MVRGTYSNANRQLVKIEKKYDPFVSDQGSLDPQITSDKKIQMYGGYSVRNYPDSSSSNCEFIAYMGNIGSAVDGKYFRLRWDGLNVAGWIAGTWREIVVRGHPSADGIYIKVNPNFIDYGWGNGESDPGILFDDKNLPNRFEHSGGFVELDWVRSTTSSGNTRYIENWYSYNAYNYKRYDTLGRPYIKEKYRAIIYYDFAYWVCLKSHTHNPSDPGPTTPFFGSKFWQKLQTDV